MIVDEPAAAQRRRAVAVQVADCRRSCPGRISAHVRVTARRVEALRRRSPSCYVLREGRRCGRKCGGDGEGLERVVRMVFLLVVFCGPGEMGGAILFEGA